MLIPGDVVEITDFGPARVLAQRFEYPKHVCECPLCGGVGIAWLGWWSCDGECRSVIAFIGEGHPTLPTGTMFEAVA